MNKKLVGVGIVLMLAVLACSFGPFNSQTVIGSGKIGSETRSLSGFDWIELKSSADVTVSFGEAGSVEVVADDNIVPLIATSVVGSKLVINTRLGASISTSNPIRVNVTLKSLHGVTLSGSGRITASAVAGKDVVVELPGSGEITLSGTADSVTITLPGSGSVFCSELQVPSAKVTLPGSGTVTVYASEKLDASIPGSGTIHYSGSPSLVQSSITGSGKITH